MNYFLVWIVLRICAFGGGLSSYTFEIGVKKLWVKYCSFFTGVPFKRHFVKQISELSDFEICSASTLWILETCTDTSDIALEILILILIKESINWYWNWNWLGNFWIIDKILILISPLWINWYWNWYW